MAYALGLPDALRRRGLAVEVVPGWETRSAGTFNPKGAVCHWTAGPAGSQTRPSLNVVTNGRPGLDGPLCNVYGARDGVAVVVAAGRANHAGTGGWKGLVGNSAVFGTEMEAAGPDDFTDAQRWSYPRINAAYCDLGSFGADMVCGHSEWATPAGRKTDINNYPMSAMRAQVAALLTGTDVQEDDVNAEQDKLIRETRDIVGGLAYLLNPPGGEAEGEILTRLRDLSGLTGALRDTLADPAGLANAMRAHLGDLGAATGVPTQEQLEAALRNVLGSLDAAK